MNKVSPESTLYSAICKEDINKNLTVNRPKFRLKIMLHSELTFDFFFHCISCNLKVIVIGKFKSLFYQNVEGKGHRSQ